MTGFSIGAGIDDARLDMFARKQIPYKTVPPTLAALIQHAKHAAYQAGCKWAREQCARSKPKVLLTGDGKER